MLVQKELSFRRTGNHNLTCMYIVGQAKMEPKAVGVKESGQKNLKGGSG